LGGAVVAIVIVVAVVVFIVGPIGFLEEYAVGYIPLAEQI
jgi:hypothetical protein